MHEQKLSLTDDVDCAACDDSPFATNDVRDVASSNSAKEGTTREDRHDEGLVRGRESGRSWAFDAFVELSKAIDTVDVSRIIAKENTAKRRERAKEVRLPGHGSLNAIDIASGSEGSAAGHDCGCMFSRWMTDEK